MTADTTAPPLPAPDWYPDPGGGHEFRYWNGNTWTDGVADSGVVTEEALPQATLLPQLPAKAGWFALGGLVATVALSAIGVGIGLLVARHSLAVRLVIAQIGLWGGLAGACWLASRRLGKRGFLDDLGIRFRATDVWRGLGAAFVARVAVVVVTTVLFLADRKLVGHNLITPRLADRGALITYAVIAAVGAPLVEETFFRGLLLRSLRGRFGPGVAIPVQAVIFGLCHMNPIYGLANVTVVMAITSFGIIAGYLAEHYRRLGPGMCAHAWFNLVTVLALVAAS